MEKIFGLGITVGRFQTFHNGHKEMLEKALALCDTVGVFIGSSQESGTEKNPFSYEIRKKTLKTVFGDDIQVYPLPDIGVGNNAEWGEYVLRNVRRYFGKNPDLLISGKEERRLNWFDGISGLSIAELYIPKAIDICASEMREMLKKGDFEAWKQYTDTKLWQDFDTLRNAVLASLNNTQTDSL